MECKKLMDKTTRSCNTQISVTYATPEPTIKGKILEENKGG
jgi:hypothetical protein